VNMPGMDGFAATRRLKADDATKRIPVVFVTGKNQKADVAWARMLGAKGYITKPYSREQILEQLKG
jgi:CheY-like chemotaxis protein